MDDRGDLSWFLGMRVSRTSDRLSVDQEQYIKTVLQRFGMEDCKAIRTPADVNLKGLFETGDVVDQREYRGLVGALLHIGKYTRPDILNTVNILFRFLDRPSKTQWVAGKHVLRYLNGTSDLKLTYSRHASTRLVGAADADWNGDSNDRRSTTGFYFKLEGTGGAVSWSVKKQQTVSLSSSEAEYQSMAAAVQEALYLRQLLNRPGR